MLDQEVVEVRITRGRSKASGGTPTGRADRVGGIGIVGRLAGAIVRGDYSRPVIIVADVPVETMICSITGGGSSLVLVVVDITRVVGLWGGGASGGVHIVFSRFTWSPEADATATGITGRINAAAALAKVSVFAV